MIPWELILARIDGLSASAKQMVEAAWPLAIQHQIVNGWLGLLVTVVCLTAAIPLLITGVRDRAASGFKHNSSGEVRIAIATLLFIVILTSLPVSIYTFLNIKWLAINDVIYLIGHVIPLAN